jgi:hypothetical protein
MTPRVAQQSEQNPRFAGESPAVGPCSGAVTRWRRMEALGTALAALALAVVVVAFLAQVRRDLRARSDRRGAAQLLWQRRRTRVGSASIVLWALGAAVFLAMQLHYTEKVPAARCRCAQTFALQERPQSSRRLSPEALLELQLAALALGLCALLAKVGPARRGQRPRGMECHAHACVHAHATCARRRWAVGAPTRISPARRKLRRTASCRPADWRPSSRPTWRAAAAMCSMRP